jgi:acetyl esterase/lipase
VSAGRWPSPLDAATVAAAGLRLAQPMQHGGWTYWLEGRPSEDGRVALRRARDRDDGALQVEELAPAPLSVRTRVHEYGGGAYLACDAGLFFVAEGVLADGRGAREGALWWRKPADGAALSELELLATVPGLRFADLCWDATRARLLCVIEDLRADPHRPRNLIGAIALDRAHGEGAVTELVAGRGFYASPRVSADGATLAFLAWDLPDMPWDGAALHTAPLDAAGAAGTPAVRAGPAAFQPEFAADGALWWSDDAGGRFALARAAAPGAAPRAFPDGERECALPLWNLNMRCYAFADARTVVAASVAEGLWALRALDPAAGRWRTLADDLTQLDQVHAADGVAVVLGGGPREPLGVHRFDLARGTRRTLARASSLALDPAALSAPEPVRFAGAGGEVHALWWPPASATHALDAGERPPLLLRCHGGPTAAAQSALDARTLYWTTRGFAVLDLNYRGSWGFGRDYRRALDGRWGELDAHDAVAAARWAIASGRADPARVAITGSSAGGLTAVNALALPDAPFRSAAIHYGLAELVSAMTDTHKFEAGYGERLLGPWPAARAVYEARSPLTRLLADDGAARGWPPTLLLQGADDKVVPPDQSARLAEALRARGVAVELRVYPGEGHGFRRATTIVDVLERELAFHLAARPAAATGAA